MPWRTQTVVEARVQLLRAYLEGRRSVTELARGFGISRKTAHKFIRRLLEDGLIGAQDRSCAPRTHPTAMARGLARRRRSARRPIARGLTSTIPIGLPNELWTADRLSAWFIRLGIRPERIAPGQPQQNGRHERFHRTLKDVVARPPAASRLAQQRACAAFVHEYNHERPHAALQNRTPADLYQPSPRPYPRRLPPLEYPRGWVVRHVQSRGQIRWYGEAIFISEALHGQPLGLNQIADTRWAVRFGRLDLGILDVRCRRLVPHTVLRWIEDPAIQSPA